MSESNGLERINRNEFEQACGEMVSNIVDTQEALNTLRRAHNTLAEAVGLNRFLLEKFVPRPLIEAAVKEFKDARQREIAAASTPLANA